MNTQLKTWLSGYALLAGFLLSTWAYGEGEKTYQVDLPAQSVAESLIDLSEQIDVLLLFPSEIASKLKANPVHGRYTLAQALEFMLEGTGYSGSVTKEGVLMISLREASERRNHEITKSWLETRR